MEPKDYILKAAEEIDLNSSLFIPTSTKKEQQKLFTKLCHLAQSYTTEVDPTISLAVMKTFQDKRLWIKIEKTAAAAMLYVKKADGTVEPLPLKETK